MSATPQSMRGTNPWTPRPFRIEGIIAELTSVWTFCLSPEEGDSPSFQPGQFNMLYVPGFGEAAISISSSTYDIPQLQHTFRAVGNVTGALSRLREGDQIGVRGPFGNSWPVMQLPGKNVIFVAGGIGLAPLRPVIEYTLQNRTEYEKLKLIYGAKSPDVLLYRREFSRWTDAGLEIEVTVDRGTPHWQGHIGVVTEIMRPFPGDPEQTQVLVCGPEVMMRFVAREAISLGVPPAQVFLSLERNMKCAMGMCGVCQFGPEFICKDGPVFPFNRIQQYLRLEDL
ncbi:Ni/Fe hydrogenase subunit gamma [Blastopirellula marina]|uniref:Ni/Fe hydrogenase subunit gamma n=1 Tax=Blastopirellula marina TaxID=124 RepID=A0A2S8F0H0_9BACT|nr:MULTISPECIES: FAD/NAD(P)-binding protein [Pirellulaceae]PQO25637.1 Ni/Fe hydrogenase subunit gamma [Blastopirellula marina]RCS43320.1 Ni/Fe hydrogenase subunit gamma [Bremerella cremea]